MQTGHPEVGRQQTELMSACVMASVGAPVVPVQGEHPVPGLNGARVVLEPDREARV